MKKHRKLLYLFAALLVMVTCCPAPVVRAQKNEEEEDKTAAPYFFVESEETGVDSFPLKKTSVSASINGIIADVRVVQTYANEGNSPINARYVFPASTKAAVHGMQMQIGSQTVTAVIKEKEEAAQEFEAAKSAGKSASMMSEQTANVFTMDVANIMPGDDVRIELHYTELITPVDGVYQFVFPTVVGPRYVGPILDDSGTREEWTGTPYLMEGAAPFDAYDINVNVSAGVPITSLSSSSHDINIGWTENTNANVTLADSSDYAGNRDFILDYKLTDEQISSGLITSQCGDTNFFMLMLEPPERYEAVDIPDREYIFVLDVSGSMSGFPLDTAKELINNLVSDLRETDTFNLILFSGTSYQMSTRSLPATKENVDRALNLIQKQSGAGGTELSAALEQALRNPADEDTARNIVIITDGYIYGESDVFQLINENLDQADFFSFGIGSAVNRYLIDGIAAIGQGESFIVTKVEQAAKTAEKFRTYIQSPVLTDIKVSFQNFDAYDVEPMLLPTLYAQKPVVLLGKWRGEASGTIQITGKTGSGDFSQSIHVADAVSDAGGSLCYLWARKRMERLTDYGSYDCNPEVQEEVTQLGLSYSMITPYTSFIAVLDTVRNPDGESTDVDQPLPLPLEVSNLAVGYRVGSEPGEMILLLGLAVILLLPTLLKLKDRKRKKRITINA